jgi:hypothetical protein
MKDDDLKIPGLTPDAISTLQNLEKIRRSGGVIDPSTKEALSAIDLVSRVMNTVTNGGQIDPVFLKNILEEYRKKLPAPEKSQQKKIIKKKKLKRV